MSTAPLELYAKTEFEVRAEPDGTGGSIGVVEGHAAVFNKRSEDLGGFVEEVEKGAFKRTLKNNPDTRALINHDPNHLLGRTRSGTLELSTDSEGLAYRIQMPERSDARDLMVSMERGDLTQSSFGFWITRDRWEQTDDGYPIRMIEEASLDRGDVSPVTYPAYPDADSGIGERALRSLSDHFNLPLETVRACADSNTLCQVIEGVIVDEDQARSRSLWVERLELNDERRLTV